jgi:hypothetical protein
MGTDRSVYIKNFRSALLGITQPIICLLFRAPGWKLCVGSACSYILSVSAAGAAPTTARAPAATGTTRAAGTASCSSTSTGASAAAGSAPATGITARAAPAARGSAGAGASRPH